MDSELCDQRYYSQCDWAIARTNSAGIAKVNAPGESSPEANQELFVFQKIDGDWKIACCCFSITNYEPAARLSLSVDIFFERRDDAVRVEVTDQRGEIEVVAAPSAEALNIA